MATTGLPDIDIPSLNLSRLLSRLSRLILSPGPENELLRKSNLERKRVGANLDYARTLLLQLEQQSFAIKAQTRRHAFQVDLADRKDLVARLNEQLYQFNEDGDDDEEPDDGEGEDLLGERNGDSTDQDANTASLSSPQNVPSPVKSSLDQRKPFTADQDSASPTTLFNQSVAAEAGKDVGITTSSDHDPSLADTEKLLSFNRYEQEDLTASLLTMAQALKASSQAFSSSLESEKEIVDRATEGLDKNTTGMGQAEKRMGTLRRMTEGRGWFGRLLIYAWIAGLWLVALVIVLVLPKLRF